MKKFGEIEAKYLKIDRLKLLVFLSLLSTVILGANSREQNAGERMQEREKKSF
jgi:hypothetical protein